jgi:hypothetical protein
MKIEIKQEESQAESVRCRVVSRIFADAYRLGRANALKIWGDR